MNIDQIISTVPDQEAHDHIRRQYQSDLQVFGEREALEFARFRADANAAKEAETDNRIKDAVSSGRLKTAVYATVYTAILFFAIGFILGRLL